MVQPIIAWSVRKKQATITKSYSSWYDTRCGLADPPPPGPSVTAQEEPAAGPCCRSFGRTGLLRTRDQGYSAGTGRLAAVCATACSRRYCPAPATPGAYCIDVHTPIAAVVLRGEIYRARDPAWDGDDHLPHPDAGGNRAVLGRRGTGQHRPGGARLRRWQLYPAGTRSDAGAAWRGAVGLGADGHRPGDRLHRRGTGDRDKFCRSRPERGDRRPQSQLRARGVRRDRQRAAAARHGFPRDHADRHCR